MQSWSSGWAVPELATNKMFCRQAAAGFSGISLQDITVNTLPSHRRLFMLGCLGYPFEWSLWKLGLHSDTQHGNIRAALDQWHLIKRKLCFYGLFTATKNVNKN
ncbi:hypothetical protein ACTVPT_26445 [Serratia bockelmannii]|uniref:hypothetical protein n=1 Tax=Serratia TaxID=613 RepID=UPI001469C2EA|nr:hypothetical protein [Serratia marcescens]NMT27146.1 hypothetical protein [Serratia marcescens]